MMHLLGAKDRALMASTESLGSTCEDNSDYTHTVTNDKRKTRSGEQNNKPFDRR